MLSEFPKSVRVVEVGPRDGLQNINQDVPTSVKIELIQRLRSTGLRSIEITSFVSPASVPQLADCRDVVTSSKTQELLRDPSVHATVLVPNSKGLQVAQQHGVKEVAVFVSASEGFSRANTKCTVQQGLDRASEVAKVATAAGIRVRGYVSCIFACPFDGSISHSSVYDCVRRLLDMGCYEVSLGDTTGVGVPQDVASLLGYLTERSIPINRMAGHFHDTYGQAIANVWAAMARGLRTFDSSIAGLGGCPHAPGAKGNLASEDLVYSLHQAHIETGVDYDRLVEVGAWISEQLGQDNHSRAGTATTSSRARSKPSIISPKLRWTSETDNQELEEYRVGPNLKIVLNNPKSGNALTERMIAGLIRIFDAAASDTSITRIVITARGKFFCTGMDLGKKTSPVAKDRIAADAQYVRLARLFEVIDKSPKVTIAGIQGPAFGGGVGLALACDVRLMSVNTEIKLSEVRLGLAPATISKYVIRELGLALSREAMLSARPLTAAELGRIGVIRIVAEQMDVALDAYLTSLRSSAPHASSMVKDLVRASWQRTVEEQEREIKTVFRNMMMASSESAYGLQQFQAGVRNIDWDNALLPSISKPKL